MAFRPFRPGAIKEDLVPEPTGARQLGTATKLWLAAFITTLTVAALTLSGNLQLGGALNISTGNITTANTLFLSTGGATRLKINSTGSIFSAGLANCDTIDTGADGKWSCGTDTGILADATNGSNINVLKINSTNITQGTNYYHVFGNGAPAYIYYNGSALIMKVT